ncbi:MAG: hypothetical protein HYX92_21685 [Chloroflexi bacterium]|nr:hypothetical protein [Chloroflexota bacterium]
MVYNVLSPVGEPTVKVVGGAPRLENLNGKTICEVWNGGFRGQVAFPVIRELLQRRYRDVSIVPYTEFPIQDVIGSTERLQELVEIVVRLAKEKGCDAMITAMGF